MSPSLHLPEAHGRISLPSRRVRCAHGHRAEAAARGVPENRWMGRRGHRIGGTIFTGNPWVVAMKYESFLQKKSRKPIP